MIHMATPSFEDPYFYVECRRCLKAAGQCSSPEHAEIQATHDGFVCVFGAWVCGRCNGEIQGTKP